MSQYRYQKNQARICSELVEQSFRLERLSLSIINIYRVHILVCITCKPPSHLLLLYGIRYFIINANLMSNSMAFTLQVLYIQEHYATSTIDQ